MYEDFFGLKENPFRLTPDPSYLFLSRAHEDALAHMQYGVEQKAGFVLITGGVGTGKTTLCRTFLQKIANDNGYRTALILNPLADSVELLQSINHELRIEHASSSRRKLIQELNSYLIDQYSCGRTVVLIIDECQQLSDSALEQIRILSNLETDSEKLLQMILVGQPELLARLKSPHMVQLNERITVRYHLEPLSSLETGRYVLHRLRVAGRTDSSIFSRASIKRIHKLSEGVPRRINTLCDRALLICYTENRKRVSAKDVDLALKDTIGSYGKSMSYPRSAADKKLFETGKMIAIVVLLVFAVTALFLFGSPAKSRWVANGREKLARIVEYLPFGMKNRQGEIEAAKTPESSRKPKPPNNNQADRSVEIKVPR